MLNPAPKLMFVVTQPVVGGAQKYVFDLAKNFSNSGNYEVSAAIGGSPQGDLFKKLSGENIKTHHLKFLRREVNIFKDVSAFFEMFKLFRKKRPDLVHLNSSKTGLLGAKAAWLAGWGRRRKPKIIFTAHGWVFKEDMSDIARWVKFFLAWLAAKFQDRIICVSEDDFNQAVKYKIAPPRKLCVVHNAVGGTKFISPKNARAEIGKMIGREIPNDAFMIVNLGRLYANKGLDYLIEAVKEIKNKLTAREIFLVIFGDGPEKENLKSQISNLKLENSVFLVGDAPEAAKYLPAFDVLVLSSTKEGFPYAVLEAGLAGVPVVASDVGGVPEIVEKEKTGLMVEPGDPAALAEAVAEIILDPAGAKKMAGELKKLVSQKFDFKTMAEKTEWVYKI